MYGFEAYNEYDHSQINKLIQLMYNTEQKVVVIGGLPNSGKTTLSKYFNDYMVISKNALRAKYNIAGKSGLYAKQKELCQEALASGKSILFDATYLSMKARSNIFTILRELKADIDVYCIFINCSSKEAIKRNGQLRTNEIDEEDISINKNIPDYIIEEMEKVIYLPFIEEGFKDVIILNVYDKQYTVNENAKQQLFQLINLSYHEINTKIHELNWDSILPSYKYCIDYNQNNSNHSYVLHEHMLKAADYIRQNRNMNLYINQLLFLAMLFHDIGKPYVAQDFGKLKHNTDVFKKDDKVIIKQGQNGFISAEKKNYKGYSRQLLSNSDIVIDPNTHYYNHDTIGALILYKELAQIGFDEEDLTRIYHYVADHMLIPFHDRLNKKTIQKIRQLRENIIDDLVIIRQADLYASNSRHDEHILQENIEALQNG